MGLNATEISVCLHKSLICTIKTCYRSAHEHPFALGMLLFSFFLYKFLPWLFFFLVSSSPVIICTAVLLGTLLSFGNPYIPEIDEEIDEEDEKIRRPQHEISSLRTVILGNEAFVEKDESFAVENYTSKSRDLEVNGLKERDLGFKGKIDEDDGFVSDSTDGVEGLEEEIHREKIVNGEFDEGKPLIEGENDVGAQYSILREKESEGEEVENFGSVHYSSISKGIDDNGVSSDYDSDSDQAESSSPDASMAEIMPMLDELHPLLDSELSQPAIVSVEDDVASEKSLDSTDESDEEEAENVGIEDDEDGEEEEEEEEEQKQGHDDGTEAVVTWTKEDEKNLMDLGNSELERNRRLESLIARRRARKSFRMTMNEKNLIDFDGFDLPFPMAQISTARQNPFDLHYDSNEGIDLPPIPGSAPSVLAPRRNPFDIPYDPLEEKPNLAGGSFDEEIFTNLEKDTHFRRYESFNVGSSYIGESQQDKPKSKLRPYFVPEPLHSEGIDYPTFQRQMSEISESKMSSVTDVESLSSTSDHDNHKNLTEEESSHSIPHVEQELSTQMSHVEHERDHIELESSSSSEVDLDEVDRDLDSHRSLVVDEAEEELSQPITQAEQELPHPLSHLEDAPHHVEVESSTSEEIDVAEFDQEYQRETAVDEENASESTSLEMESIPSPVGSDSTDVKPDVVEEKHTELSSSSSSEVNTTEGLEISEPKTDDNPVNHSNEASIEGSDLQSELVEDIQVKEPLYDWNWNPSEVEKTLSGITIIEEALNYGDRRGVTSTSSVVSDMVEESQEIGSTPVQAQRTISSIDEESLLHNGSIEEALNTHAVEVNNLSYAEVTEDNEHDVIEATLSGNIQNENNLTAPMMPSVAEEVVCGSGSSSSETEFEDESLRKEENEHPQVHISNADLSPVHTGVSHSNANEEVSIGVSSEGSTQTISEVPPPLLEEGMAHSSSGGDHERSQEPSSSVAVLIDESKANDDSDEVVHGDGGVDSSSHSVLVSSPALILPETSGNDLHEEIHRSGYFEDLGHSNISQGPTEADLTDKELDEVDGISEIDEGFLAELDAVGDFAVEDVEGHPHGSQDSIEALASSQEDHFAPVQNEMDHHLQTAESRELSPDLLESAMEAKLDSDELIVESDDEEKSKAEETREILSSSDLDESKMTTELEAVGDVSVESLETNINQTENIPKDVESLTGLQILEDNSSKDVQDLESRTEEEVHSVPQQLSEPSEISPEVVDSAIDIKSPSATNESEDSMREASVTGLQVLEDNASQDVENNSQKTEDLHSEISTSVVDAIDIKSHSETTEPETSVIQPSLTGVQVFEENVSQKTEDLQEAEPRLETEVHVTDRELPVDANEDQLKPTEFVSEPAELTPKVAKVHSEEILTEESKTISNAEETGEGSSSSTTVVKEKKSSGKSGSSSSSSSSCSSSDSD